VKLRLKSSMNEKEPFSSSDAAWRSSSSSTSIPTSIFIFSNAWFIFSISLLFLTLFLEKIWGMENWICVRIRVRKLSLLRFAAKFSEREKMMISSLSNARETPISLPPIYFLIRGTATSMPHSQNKKNCPHLLLRANPNHLKCGGRIWWLPPPN